MPELPDLQYIVGRLRLVVAGWRITGVTIKEPIVVRMLVPGAFTEVLPGQTFRDLERHGPFLRFRLDSLDMVAHPMLDGRFQWGRRRGRGLCFTLDLEDEAGNSVELRYLDAKKMGKVYVTSAEGYRQIPGYRDQGIDVLGDGFTPEAFRALIAGRRHQARVFLMDHAALDVIGNAYALMVGLVNAFVGSNYLFVAHKPETASLLDVLPAWPWYILFMELIAAFFFLLLYLPFARQNRKTRLAEQGQAA